MSIIYKYYLVIISFNTFFSLFVNQPENITIKGNVLKRINLIEGEQKKITLEFKENKTNYILFKSLNKTNFTLNSGIFNNFESNFFYKGVNLSSDNSTFTINNINSEYNNTIDIINVIKEDNSSYYEIKNEDAKYKLKKNQGYNFIIFLYEKKNEVEINFKNKPKGKYSCAIVELDIKDINYIPRAFNFEARNESLEIHKDLEKENIIKFEKSYIEEDENNNKNFAFVFSIESDGNIDEYTVIFNKDIMNKFVIGIIILALIFGIITFFLIRRKQVMTKSIGDDFYDENNEEEKEN